MAKVERIMFCLDELGGAEPSLDQDICRPRGIRYRGLSVTPPKEWLSPWSRKRDEGRTGNWKLCVPEASAAGDALQQEESGRNEAVERVVKARIRILAVVFPVQRARPRPVLPVCVPCVPSGSWPSYSGRNGPGELDLVDLQGENTLGRQ